VVVNNDCKYHGLIMDANEVKLGNTSSRDAPDTCSVTKFYRK
jgi:hypothetical protein